jgi:hypothetical protein
MKSLTANKKVIPDFKHAVEVVECDQLLDSEKPIIFVDHNKQRPL